MTGHLRQIADEYFATINPIASRIQMDIMEIANAYEHLWTEFSQREQSDVINETLIKPEIVLKYFDSFLPGNDSRDTDSNCLNSNRELQTAAVILDHGYLYDGKHLRTFAQCKTGLKENQDDVCGIYRDEHSLPFSCKTKSQINFNAFDFKQIDCSCTDSDAKNIIIRSQPLQNQQQQQEKPQQEQYTQLSKAKHLTTKRELNDNENVKSNQFYDKNALPLLMFNTAPNDLLPNRNRCTGGNFLTKLLPNTQPFIQTNGNSTMHFDDDQEQLVANISLGMQSSSSIQSDPDNDDQINTGELSLLLENGELKKGYDFLNNW